MALLLLLCFIFLGQKATDTPIFAQRCSFLRAPLACPRSQASGGRRRKTWNSHVVVRRALAGMAGQLTVYRACIITHSPCHLPSMLCLARSFAAEERGRSWDHDELEVGKRRVESGEACLLHDGGWRGASPLSQHGTPGSPFADATGPADHAIAIASDTRSRIFLYCPSPALGRARTWVGRATITCGCP